MMWTYWHKRNDRWSLVIEYDAANVDRVLADGSARIADLAKWDRDLTPEEIAALRKGQRAIRLRPRPLEYYPLDRK